MTLSSLGPKTNFPKFGSIAVLGRTNAGKSSLINAFVGEKVSIVSNHPQTTRRKTLGILTRASVQIAFCDTPGFHPKRNKLDGRMEEEILESLEGVDGALYLIDASDPNSKEDANFLSSVQCLRKIPLSFVFNKIDLLEENQLSKIKEHYKGKEFSCANFFVSVTEKRGLGEVLNHIIKWLPFGDFGYDPDIFTSSSEREIVEEIIREGILNQCYHEVPHSVAVVVSDFVERENGKTWIRAEIYLERESQKKILIGSSGSMIKQLGTNARKQLNHLLGRDIFLELWVKVRLKWRNQENWISRLVFKKP
ncbi:GTPase Era [bacterium]|nr:GTPase Era [bacterium]